MNVILSTAAILAIVLSTSAVAQQTTTHPMGEHPAVIAKRLAEKQGYDYASKFYPHPAWMHLYADSDGPALAEAAEAAKAKALHAEFERTKAATAGATIGAAATTAQPH